MKAEDFDKKFDDDQEDLVAELDLSSAHRPNMGINTAITHVTRAGANIFSELGFGDDEARQLHEQAQAQIKMLKTPRSAELAAKRECK